ncbi:HNH endonuclease [Streptomyces sp. NPDC088768]|uniref:HNH endonuclease n=1 Tax=Streptomyces sp. NPDC088768 TaxID=3365894 RepID=UPI003821D3FD
MARGHGRILTTIWEDPDFLALSEAAQRLYFFLISQPNLSHAGLLPLTARRWASTARALTEDLVRERLAVLEAAGFVAVDPDDEEVFIVDHFTHHGTGLNPRLAAAAYDAITVSASPRLRSLASMQLGLAVAKSPDTAPRGVRALVLEQDGWQCRHCGWQPGDPVPAGRPLARCLELDHVHPRSRGGSDDVSNLQVLCTSCNTSKGARI